MKHLFLFFFLAIGVSVFSQTKVSGLIKDTSGEPVSFANVIFKDSQEGTISDENGRFYLESGKTYKTVIFSFIGFTSKEVELTARTNYNMEVVIEESADALDEVVVYTGKTSKKNNPAIDILRKIWENRRENGVKKFNQYQYNKYEKLEFDLNTIDSNLMKSRIFKGMEFIFDQVDTSSVTGNTYLPIFINEAVSKVYGNNSLKKEKEVLQ